MFNLSPELAAPLHMAGKVGYRALNKFGKIALPGVIGSGLLGAGVGGILGLARGDNYDSTATMRNFATGALAGAAIGLGGRAALGNLAGGLGHMSGIRQAMRAGSGARFAAFKSAPLPSIIGRAGKLTGSVANAGLRAGGFLAKHPGLTASAAILGGAGIYMSGAGSSTEYSAFPGYQDQTDDTTIDSRSEFHASTRNLVQGLNRSRHR